MIQKPPHLFISYSRKDEVFAQKLVNDLKKVGFGVWLDRRNILPGANWGQSIQEGLDSTDAMLLLVTPDSMASNNVSLEWQYYFDNHKPIFPILLKPARMSFQISRVQYIDFANAPYSIALDNLLQRLKLQSSTSDTSSARTLETEQHLVEQQPIQQLIELEKQFEMAQKTSDWDQVIETGRKLRELDSGKSNKLKILLGILNAYKGRAIKSLNHYDYENAIGDFNSFLEVSTGNHVEYHLRGVCYYSK